MRLQNLTKRQKRFPRRERHRQRARAVRLRRRVGAVSRQQRLREFPQVTITTQLVAKYLGLENDKYSISFQSRLANEPWLKPYTDSELERFAKEGKKNMVVVTPAFVTDCLETLEEIVMEAKEVFLEAGGENYYYVPCLNDDDNWAKLITKWAKLKLSS